MDPNHPHYEWVSILQGRVAQNSHMSASIWSLRPEAGTALIVSATHTLGQGYLGPGGTMIEERILDPSNQNGATRIYLVKDMKGSVDTLASVLFILYHPMIPADQSGNYLRDIHPRYDFFVGVLDSQKVVMDPFPTAPEPLIYETPSIVDPAGLTMLNPTYTDAVSGESVMLMGYPQEEEYEGKLAASIGRILSDQEAEDAIRELSGLGDEEGEIEYDPEAEILIEGHAVVGMSGGGVYNQAGQQIGILVRASNEYNGKQYVRAVKMTFVAESLSHAFESLSESNKSLIKPYLESTIQSRAVAYVKEPMILNGSTQLNLLDSQYEVSYSNTKVTNELHKYPTSLELNNLYTPPFESAGVKITFNQSLLAPFNISYMLLFPDDQYEWPHYLTSTIYMLTASDDIFEVRTENYANGALINGHYRGCLNPSGNKTKLGIPLSNNTWENEWRDPDLTYGEWHKINIYCDTNQTKVYVDGHQVNTFNETGVFLEKIQLTFWPYMLD